MIPPPPPIIVADDEGVQELWLTCFQLDGDLLVWVDREDMAGEIMDEV